MLKKYFVAGASVAVAVGLTALASQPVRVGLDEKEIQPIRRPVGPPVGSPSETRSRTFTDDADFLEGTLINLNLDQPGALQLEETLTAPFPLFNVPARSRGTLIRINTRTGEVIGEYRCFPEGINRSGYYGVCRTAVDSEGAVWVCDRNNSTNQPATIVKIGVVLGGERVRKEPNGDIVPDPDGAYLRPPFDYISSGVVDRDGDGLIKTSRGLSDLMPWPAVTDQDGGGATFGPALVEDAEDELVLVYMLTTGTNEWAAIAVDGEDNLYASAMNPRSGYALFKYDGFDGSRIADLGNQGEGGYSAIIDNVGVLWTGGGYTNRALRYDTSSDTGVSIGGYSGRATSWAQAPNGRIWCVSINGVLYEHDQNSGAILRSFTSSGSNNRSIAFSGPNDLWTGLNSQSRVARIDPTDGSLKASIVVGSAPTNVGVDTDGFVWATNQGSNTAVRIDPATNAVDTTVDLGSGAGPYNYNDGTGQVTAVLNQRGFWRVVHDGCVPGSEWFDISWNADVPSQTSLGVAIRAADSVIDLTGEPWTPVTNGQSLDGVVTGRFIEMRATLARDQDAPPAVTPVLYDLTINAKQLPQFLIDVYPNRFPNPIILSRDYTVYVAVLNPAGRPDAADFLDPATVNWAALAPRFGRAGAATATPVAPARLMDIDGDGDIDALFGFRTIDAGFILGDTMAEFRVTRECEDALGMDSVLVQP